jgi:hypothetical protein
LNCRWTRESEEAGAFAVDVGSESGRVDHEIDQALDVVWPLDVDRKIVCPAQIRDRIAGMIDRSHDKSGVSEHLIGVVMTDEIAPSALGDDDERQFLAEQRTVLNPGQGEFPEIHLSCRLGAGILDRSLKSRAVGVGLYIDGPEAGALSQRRAETEDDRAEQFARVHRGASCHQRLYQIFDLCPVLRNDALDLFKQIPPRCIDVGRPIGSEKFAQGVGDHAKELAEQLTRRAAGVVRRDLALDHAKASLAPAGKIQHRIDGQREH